MKVYVLRLVHSVLLFVGLRQPKKAKRGRNPFLQHRAIIGKMMKVPGALNRYRLLYRQVKGTAAEEVFWDLLRWRVHADEMQALTNDLSHRLYLRAKELDQERCRLKA